MFYSFLITYQLQPVFFWTNDFASWSPRRGREGRPNLSNLEFPAQHSDKDLGPQHYITHIRHYTSTSTHCLNTNWIYDGWMVAGWDISCGPHLVWSGLVCCIWLYSPGPSLAGRGKQELLYIWWWRLLTLPIHRVCYINQIYFKVKLPL